MSTYVHVKLSPAFKKALGDAAALEDEYVSEYVRKTLAKACGYDLAKEDEDKVLGRPRKYKSAKERENAKQERRHFGELVKQAIMKKERLEGAQALEDYLRARGVILDDEVATV